MSNKNCFLCLCYLACQGLPLHDLWPNRKNQNVTSPEVQNEILKEMSLSILRVFLSLIKTYFHSIMVNETSGLLNKEQAVFRVRWVD